MAAELNGGGQHIFNTDFFDVALCSPDIALTNIGRTATATAAVDADNMGHEFMHVVGINVYAVGEHEIRIRFDKLLESSSVFIGMAFHVDLHGLMGVNTIGWTWTVGEDADGCLSGDEFHLHIDRQNLTFTTHNIRTGCNVTNHDIGAPRRLFIGIQTANASVSVLPS